MKKASGFTQKRKGSKEAKKPGIQVKSHFAKPCALYLEPWSLHISHEAREAYIRPRRSIKEQGVGHRGRENEKVKRPESYSLGPEA